MSIYLKKNADRKAYRIRKQGITEKTLEKWLKREIEALGGLCLKLQTPGMTGIPDRLVLLPSGKVWFVEVKKLNGVVSLRQRKVMSQLRDLGFRAEVIQSLSDIHKHFNELLK